jgi:hypothetical protein
LEEVQSTIKTKELTELKDLKVEDSGDAWVSQEEEVRVESMTKEINSGKVDDTNQCINDSIVTRATTSRRIVPRSGVRTIPCKLCLCWRLVMRVWGK